MKIGPWGIIGRGLWVNLFFCILLVSLGSGCAFSRTTVKVDFAPVVTQPIAATHKAALQVGEIKDSRLVTDRFVLMQKSNDYGTTSGAYVTEQPVAKIFRDGLKAVLEQNGFTGTSGAQYELRADLKNYGIHVIQNGMFSSATAKPWMEVRFELITKANGQQVWHDTYTGQSTKDLSQWTINEGKFIANAFPDASEDVIKQLIADKTFRSFFE